jgi:hypothetical protein
VVLRYATARRVHRPNSPRQLDEPIARMKLAAFREPRPTKLEQRPVTSHLSLPRRRPLLFGSRILVVAIGNWRGLNWGAFVTFRSGGR